ncbi:tryptophan synthase subunit alpha [Rossellomorea vietnamensis]|uniref:Tryptophan synthase alpha chain n=1 Tax=Rossellomorea vietnamensis TaxID=218284 RepID=A0A5D4NZ35_9BACI|nr:tryptophan synthase subunit alpha [Rossellomorea vietnamensis]TYS18744.1 tryptophan synthase subunit alpha [Rossellomorea vietnamensis]
MGKKFLEETLGKLRTEGQGIFIPYLMAGDGGLENLVDQVSFLENAGASAVEIGIPFSDPAADGPVIQEAGKRALQGGTTLTGIFETLKKSRGRIGIPVIFMTYFNPILQFGLDKFAEECTAAGVDGLIIPDLPLEHTDILKPHIQKEDIALIQLASLTSSKERLKTIAETTEGFLYAVTINGITGTVKEFQSSLKDHFLELKKVCDAPVLAGFGISTPDHVRNFLEITDGVVVGSRIIQLLQEKKLEEIKELIEAADVKTSVS